VAGSEPLGATSDAPLLCIPLPEEASGLRFSPATLAMGAEPDPSGELALRGPIPAGTSAAVLRYRIPVQGDRALLSQRFAQGVAIWSVLVADTGVSVETTRLHRRRPMRSDDRSYLHLEAFQIEPGETVALALRRLPPRRPAPRLALAGFSLALAAAGIAFLVAPLQRRLEEPSQDPAEARLETERDAIRSALQSLDEDFETGKLAASDYEELRTELRERLAELIQRREAARSAARPEAAAVSAAATAAAARCPGCASALAADARFCHRCGAAVATAVARD
jgi:cytochrome c-type biogenesis protein CcmI